MFSTILVLAGTTFQLLFRADKSVAQSFVTERSISRLAIQFRDDVHRSESGTMNVDSTTKKNDLILSDGRQFHLRYTVTKEGLARLIVDGDTITAREDYRLHDCQVRFEAVHGTDSQLLTLIIDRPGTVLLKNAPSKSPTRALSIQAFLNQHRSLVAIGDPTRPEADSKSNLETKEGSQ